MASGSESWHLCSRKKAYEKLKRSDGDQMRPRRWSRGHAFLGTLRGKQGSARYREPQALLLLIVTARGLRSKWAETAGWERITVGPKGPNKAIGYWHTFALRAS